MIQRIQALHIVLDKININSATELEAFRIEYLGSKGQLKDLYTDFKSVPGNEKREIGQSLNTLKVALENFYSEQKEKFSTIETTNNQEDWSKSGENISEIMTTIDHKKLLGIMLSCVSPENYEKNLNEIKSLDVPFGFKLNGFITTKPTAGYTNTFNKSIYCIIPLFSINPRITITCI